MGLPQIWQISVREDTNTFEQTQGRKMRATNFIFIQSDFQVQRLPKKVLNIQGYIVCAICFNEPFLRKFVQDKTKQTL